ncbi:MAG: hypothetical protein WD023_04845 [Ilumatobacteraceae bacterium]
MTAFFGADPTLLGALRAALVRSVGDLRRLHSDDPEAADAMQTVRRGIELLELRWLPKIDHALRLDTAAAVRQVEAVAAASGPLAAAPLLSSLRIDDQQLAALCVRLLLLWHAGDERGNRWPDEVEPGPNAADALFALLIDRPRAASTFLGLTAEQPGILFRSAVDETLVHRLLLVGTSPRHATTAEAGRILVPILDWLQYDERAYLHGWHGTTWPGGGRDGSTPHVGTMLGDVIAPWLLQFGNRADDWGWSREEADDSLRWIARDDVSMAALVGAIGQWQQMLAATRFTTPDGSLDFDALLDVSTTLAQLASAMREADIKAAEVRRFWLDCSLLLASAIAGLALPMVGVTGLAAAIGTAAMGAGTRAAFDHLGIVRTAEHADDAAQARFGTFTANTAVVAVVSMVGRLIDEGRLPPDCLDRLQLGKPGSATSPDDDDDDCPAGEVLADLHHFVGEVGADTDPATRSALAAVLLAFAHPTSITDAC